MDAHVKLTLQCQSLRAFALFATGILLFLAENAWMGREIAVQQMPCIVGVATLFFALGLFSALLYIRIMRGGGRQAAGFYVLNQGLRLMLAVAVLLFYAFIVRTNLVAFALNLFVLYIVEIVFSLIYSTRMEHLTKKNK